MGCLCETAIANASKSLQNANEDILNNIAEIENDIDQKERDIEGLCMKLLLQQQPVATDLRIVSAAMKMVSDMERIGDQASDIAEITKYPSKRYGICDSKNGHRKHNLICKKRP